MVEAAEMPLCCFQFLLMNPKLPVAVGGNILHPRCLFGELNVQTGSRVNRPTDFCWIRRFWELPAVRINHVLARILWKLPQDKCHVVLILAASFTLIAIKWVPLWVSICPWFAINPLPALIPEYQSLQSSNYSLRSPVFFLFLPNWEAGGAKCSFKQGLLLWREWNGVNTKTFEFYYTESQHRRLKVSRIDQWWNPRENSQQCFWTWKKKK